MKVISGSIARNRSPWFANVGTIDTCGVFSDPISSSIVNVVVSTSFINPSIFSVGGDCGIKSKSSPGCANISVGSNRGVESKLNKAGISILSGHVALVSNEGNCDHVVHSNVTTPILLRFQVAFGNG